jgi:tRNA modification GTPase
LIGDVNPRNELRFREFGGPSFAISARAGTGIDELAKALASYAEAFFSAGESVLVTRKRHREALEQAVAALDRALNNPADREELIAEEVRAAAVVLGRLTGRIDVEDVLDVIFRDFCIGK